MDTSFQLYECKHLYVLFFIEWNKHIWPPATKKKSAPARGGGTPAIEGGGDQAHAEKEG